MTSPRVAVGLFVYNGERHLCAAVDSLLAQTMGDFVLVISDNASTDRTEEICRTYEAADSRVRYIRHEENRGPVWNFNYVAEAAPDTEFYKWCAHDDLYGLTYLEQCLAELDRRPEIVACHSRTLYINESGDELMRSFRQQRFTDDRPWIRFDQVLRRNHDYSNVFALIRRTALSHVRPFPSVYAGDAVVLTDLVFQGPFGEVSDHLFANRMHPARASSTVASPGSAARTWAEWHGGSSYFPLWHTQAALRKSISSAPLSSIDRARCYGVLARWMQDRWKGLGWELATDTHRSVRARISAGTHKTP